VIFRGWGTDRSRRRPLAGASDDAGFNHVAAPLVRWTWEGGSRIHPGATGDRSGGWPWRSRPCGSLFPGRTPRGGPVANFGPEAHALGTMTARMHLALDRAFDRHPEPVSDWVDAAESVIAAADPELLDVRECDLIKSLRGADLRCRDPATHGTSSCTARPGPIREWVVEPDCTPGACSPGCCCHPRYPWRTWPTVLVAGTWRGWRPR